MNNFSTTQASNVATLVGFIGLILNHFGVNIANDELMLLVSSAMTFGGIVLNWIHRYKKGDLTLGGFRK